ncbi:hypothetical protein [Bdellovibrio sp. KM01]|uniref:hypothetical protein n=1 Tax=Bdellovibrio sp. KM01 TaxID=2748865 RepID=UPI0015EAAE62|nr:hypothetical protein [Bdellovibrio sp. KM01]QLY25836.1 hypothetical protein HW988_01970 [Bdellovibrio sp. KM01]
MGKNFYLKLTSLILFVCTAVAGNGDIGSVGDAAPSNVTSTSQLIRQYSPQSDALTIQDLCLMFDSPKIVWGKSRLRCVQRANGILEIRGYTERGTLSVFANPNDMTVYEAFGADDIQQYCNNLDQGFRIHLEWVYTESKRVGGVPVQQGYFKVDAYLTSKDQTLRVGYYDYLQ